MDRHHLTADKLLLGQGLGSKLGVWRYAGPSLVMEHRLHRDHTKVEHVGVELNWGFNFGVSRVRVCVCVCQEDHHLRGSTQLSICSTASPPLGPRMDNFLTQASRDAHEPR